MWGSERGADDDGDNNDDDEVEPPEAGVSEVRTFPRGMAEFAAFVEERGYWTEDALLQVRVSLLCSLHMCVCVCVVCVCGVCVMCV